MEGGEGKGAGVSTRRDLLKGLLGCAVAPVCAEIPTAPVDLPGFLKLRQRGPSLMFARWMEERTRIEVTQGKPEPFVRVYDLNS